MEKKTKKAAPDKKKSGAEEANKTSKPKKASAKKTKVAAPAEDVDIVLAPEEKFNKNKNKPRSVGRPLDEDRADPERMRTELRLMGADIIREMKSQVKNKQLAPKEMVQLLKTIMPYMGLEDGSQHSDEDVTIDALSEKYTEINLHIKRSTKTLRAKD